MRKVQERKGKHELDVMIIFDPGETPVTRKAMSLFGRSHPGSDLTPRAADTEQVNSFQILIEIWSCW